MARTNMYCPGHSIAALAAAALGLASCASGTARTSGSAVGLVGTWELVSRIDRTMDGREVDEPNLGRDPIAWIIYDSAGHVAAQLMRRDRSNARSAAPSLAETNNTGAINGYDAYFGTWSFEAERGTVTHLIRASVDASAVGRTVSRQVRLEGDQLTLSFQTTSANGNPVTRTVVWKRISR
jgi:Lipocalin-like domain